MRFRNLIGFLLTALLAGLALRLFLEGQPILILVSIATVVALLNWFGKRLGISKPWTTRIFKYGVAIIIVNVLVNLISYRYPTFATSLEDLRDHTMLVASDKINPKSPDGLAETLYDVRFAKAREDQMQLIKQLGEVKEKIHGGQSLDRNDSLKIEMAERRLSEIGNDLASLSALPPGSNSGKWSSGKNLPICGEEITLALNDEDHPVEVHPDCWSGWVTVPSSATGSSTRIEPPIEGWVEIRFPDGATYRWDWGEPMPKVTGKRAIFRIRGEGNGAEKSGIALVTVRRRESF